MNFQPNRTFIFQLGTSHFFYRNGYQYETKPAAQGGRGYAELLFLPTAEGYAKAVYSENLSEHEPAFYKYVYLYKDHLGNTRLSYTLHPRTGKVTILEENNYYPFGLKHGGYNTTKKDISYISQVADGTIIQEILPEAVKFKYYYQEQERQDELGLNWDSFKYRNYDYAIGRFMSVDPLAEKYAYNSTYAFQENKMGLGRELEGLEILFFHGDARASFLLTGSVSSGIYIDFQSSDVGLFFTPGLGIGLAGGASAGGGITVMPFSNINDVKGWGRSDLLSAGFIADVALSMDHTISNKTSYGDLGLTVSGGYGIEFVLAEEATYTFTLTGRKIVKAYFNTLGSEYKDIYIKGIINQKDEFISEMNNLVKQYTAKEKLKENASPEYRKDIYQEQIKIVKGIEEVTKKIKLAQDLIDDVRDKEIEK